MVRDKDILDFHTGMIVTTPMGYEAEVIAIREGDTNNDPYDRVVLKYLHLNYHRKCNNMVSLQPQLLKHYGIIATTAT